MKTYIVTLGSALGNPSEQIPFLFLFVQNRPFPHRNRQSQDDPLHHQKVRTELGLRPGGFGILIASNLMDEMIYNERHNEVVLIKYLDGDLLKPNHDIPKP